MSLRRRIAAVAILMAAGLPLAAHARGGRGTLRLYRANGRYAGRVEANGRYYGENGRYLGRVEGNRIYSAQGRYLGRFEESGAFHEPPAAAPGGGRLTGPQSGEAAIAGPERAGDGIPPGPVHDTGPQVEAPAVLAPAPGATAPAPGVSPTGGPGRLRPPAALSSDPGAGTALIEIIRPESIAR